MTSRHLQDWLKQAGPSAAALRGDVLSELLEQLRLDVWFNGLSRFAPGFGLRLPASEGATLLVVVGGSMLIGLGDGSGELQRIEAGGLVLARGGHGFSIMDQADCEMLPFDEVVPPEHVREHRGLTQGSGGHACEVIIASVRFPGGHAGGLLRSLPAIASARRDDIVGAKSVVEALLEHCRAVPGVVSDGAHAVPARLVQTLCLGVIRSCLMDAGERGAGDVFHADLDPDISAVLGLMLSTPGRDWSLQDLALEAGMSRSVFAERFRASVGRTPLAFLRGVRLEAAREALLSSDDSVAEIAARVGYGSSGAFCTAFRRAFGVSPTGYRNRV